MNNELVTCLLNGFIAPNRKVLLIFLFTPTLGPPYIYFFLDSHLRNVKISSARIFYKSFNCQYEFISSAICCMLFARKRKCPRFRFRGTGNLSDLSTHMGSRQRVTTICGRNPFPTSSSLRLVDVFAALRLLPPRLPCPGCDISKFGCQLLFLQQLFAFHFRPRRQIRKQPEKGYYLRLEAVAQTVGATSRICINNLQNIFRFIALPADCVLRFSVF